MTLEPRVIGRYALYGEILLPPLLCLALLACGSDLVPWGAGPYDIGAY